MPFAYALALAAIAGAASAATWPLAAPAACAAGVAAASCAVPMRAGPWRRACIALALGALAAAHAARARDAALAPPLGLWFAAAHGAVAASSPAVLRGVIAADATVTPGGAVRLELEVTDVHEDAGWRKAPGRILVHVQGDAAPAAAETWTAGRTVVAPVLLRWPPVLRNPGGPSPMRQRLMRSHVLAGTIKSAALIEVARARWWDETAAAVRRHVRRTAHALFADHPTTAAIVIAILIGDRAGLAPDLTRRLVDAGTYHVVAISGGNVAIVTTIVFVVLRYLVRGPRLVSIAALTTTAAYGWVVGGDPSVNRAVTAACAWLAADAAGIRAPPLHVLALVVLILLVVDPLMAVAPGAWLSFGATAGILLGAARLAQHLRARQAGGGGVARAVVAVVVGMCGATLAAELALLPVSAGTFYRVGVAGFLLNLVAIPAMTIVQVCGAVGVAMGEVWPAAARVAAAGAHGAAVCLVESARLVEWVPALVWRVPPPPALVVVAYYGALVTLVAARGGLVRRGAWVLAVAMLVVIATGPFVGRAAPRHGTARITLLDVGQGDAAIVQFPSRQVLVVDAGAASESFDTGERVVMPAIWALGARRVDWLAFTHADLDHIGGARAVAAEFEPREVWEGVPVPRDEGRAALYDWARARGRVWRPLRAGDRWEIGGAVLDVVHPPRPEWERQRVRNDDSLVFRFRYGHLEVLLTGDVGQAVEPGLVDPRDPDRRDVRILKVAHHGSRHSSDARFLAAYRPWVAVVSAGRNNAFGHPTPDVLARLDAVGAATFRTDRDGAVSIDSDGVTTTVRTWRGRQWRAVSWNGP